MAREDSVDGAELRRSPTQACDSPAALSSTAASSSSPVSMAIGGPGSTAGLLAEEALRAQAQLRVRLAAARRSAVAGPATAGTLGAGIAQHAGAADIPMREEMLREKLRSRELYQ